MTLTHKIALALIFCTLLGVVGSMDFDDHRQYEAHRCDMIALWLSDSARGVPEHARHWWPDARGDYNKTCIATGEGGGQ